MDKRGNQIGGKQPSKKGAFEKNALPLERHKGPEELDFFKEAKLFSTGDRATLTFFSSEGVASIHYDLKRNEIFYRGHNVKNMTLSPGHWESLQRFSEYLAKNGGDFRLRQAYDACLAQILPGYP